MNLLELFRDQESDLVERKASTTELDRIRQAICAYSNDLPNYRSPGVIFVGQNDDLSCANCELGDKTLLKLTQLRDDGKILPFPTMSVERKVLDGCTVAVIQVQPSENPPVQVDNRTWIRIGPRRALATAEEERRLVEKRRWGSLPFDAQAVTTATLDDLDLKRFELELVPLLASPEARAENDRDTMQKLRAARFIDRKDVPTVSAILGRILINRPEGFSNRWHRDSSSQTGALPWAAMN